MATGCGPTALGPLFSGSNKSHTQSSTDRSDENGCREDVALSALNSFFGVTKKGRFPDLADRDSLWRLLSLAALCSRSVGCWTSAALTALFYTGPYIGLQYYNTHLTGVVPEPAPPLGEIVGSIVIGGGISGAISFFVCRGMR